jgi:hypothetical protein
MRPAFFFALSVFAACLGISTAALASGPDPADYPLRVHIMKFVSQPRDTRGHKNLSDVPDYVSGRGVADLFENGEPQGFQFSFNCMGGMKASSGYGSFPARWKKRDKTLEILLPETGKPWNMVSCPLQTEMRPGLVFYWKDGALAEESAQTLKAWMAKHNYDPEKSDAEPAMAAGETVAPGDSSDPQLAGPD